MSKTETKKAEGQWETQLVHSVHELELDRGYGCFINATRATCKPAIAIGETKEECKANAAFIVKAVNCHEELVEALTAALGCLRDDISPVFRDGFEKALKNATANV